MKKNVYRVLVYNEGLLISTALGEIVEAESSDEAQKIAEKKFAPNDVEVVDEELSYIKKTLSEEEFHRGFRDRSCKYFFVGKWNLGSYHQDFADEICEDFLKIGRYFTEGEYKEYVQYLAELYVEN